MVVVDRDIVVHAAAGHTAADAAEDARVEDIEQRRSLGGWSLGTLEQLASADLTSVQLGIRILSLDDGRALQRDASEQALGLGIAEDTSNRLQGGGTGGFRVAADGTGSYRHVATQRDRPGLREGLDGAGVVQDEDEVGQLDTDLATETGASRRNGGWGTPAAVGETGDDKAGTETGGAKETGFYHCEDRKALERGAQDVSL